MLEVRRLSAGYGRAEVLFGLDFAVDKGEVVALVGRNCAG
jgi:ABC-type branched-subunit amino acid transport system ATPase component